LLGDAIWEPFVKWGEARLQGRADGYFLVVFSCPFWQTAMARARQPLPLPTQTNMACGQPPPRHDHLVTAATCNAMLRDPSDGSRLYDQAGFRIVNALGSIAFVEHWVPSPLFSSNA
jgi:hypothetical protein